MNKFFKIGLIILLKLNDAHACIEWLKNLNIETKKDCPSKCRTGETDMATYLGRLSKFASIFTQEVMLTTKVMRVAIMYGQCF